MAKIDAFFQLMHDQGASDLHLVSGQQPVIRVRGEMERIKYDVLENDMLKAILYEITAEHKIKQFEETGDVDFAYEIPGLARYRANFFQQKYGVAAVFREIPSTILTCENLGLPQVIGKLASLPRGLVLVTGPTGSGKSTTLAAIINEANRTRKDHIITVEDPIEFVHQSQSCIVNHREVGVHTKTFSSALRGAFGTLHTTSAAKTVDRIIEVFPSGEQMQIRSTLADGIRAVVAQVLFKRIDKKGRCAALEILIANSAVRNLIRESKTFQIPSMIQTGKKYGMQLLDDSIMELLTKGWISADEAYNKSNDKAKFRPFLKTPPTDFTEV
jgi:twitching motility protein PilT